ncbi:MAG TPA: hypothetical protein VFR86_00110 [Burkholderiaceae bacterium]|nr:hypothetical protein [Burkholderiaceae bacterium]
MFSHSTMVSAIARSGSCCGWAHEREACMDEHLRVGAQRTANPRQCHTREVLPRVSVVQQRIPMLSGDTDVNFARRTVPRQKAAKLGTHASDRHARRIGNAPSKSLGTIQVSGCSRMTHRGIMPRGDADEQLLAATAQEAFEDAWRRPLDIIAPREKRP